MRRCRSSVRVSPWQGLTAGLPVPPGSHVTTTAYCRFVEANALQAVIAEGNVRFLGGGGVEHANARTVRRCTPYFSDSALIEKPARSASCQIASNSSTRDIT